MIERYTFKGYTRISSGYMGELEDWPQVITEGYDLTNCQMMLKDALEEMLLDYAESGKTPPNPGRKARTP